MVGSQYENRTQCRSRQLSERTGRAGARSSAIALLASKRQPASSGVAVRGWTKVRCVVVIAVLLAIM
jgi:hypothetical protein